VEAVDTQILAKFRAAFVAGWVVTFILLPGNAAIGSEYKLSSGDVIELSVIGFADIKQRSTVGVDGEISLPLIGQVRAAGLSVEELRNTVVDALSRVRLQQNFTEGRSTTTIIDRERVSLALVEYRPIFVHGDVSTPGEQAFRPGMTARQAIAKAGGYDLLRTRSETSAVQLADIESTLNSLLLELTTEQIRNARLKAELGGQTDLVNLKLLPGVLPPEDVNRIKANELDLLRARTAQLARERAMLQDELRQADLQIGKLEERRQADREGLEEDLVEYERLKDLNQKGTIPATRLSEARRSALMTSTSYLGSIVQIAQTQRERAELVRRAQTTEDQWRTGLLGDVQASDKKIAELRSQVRAGQAKQRLLAGIRSSITDPEWRPGVVLYRVVSDREERLIAGEDTKLQPGDVLDIAVQTEGELRASPEKG
jgi:polysaccharide export outer membrane protein